MCPYTREDEDLFIRQPNQPFFLLASAGMGRHSAQKWLITAVGQSSTHITSMAGVTTTEEARERLMDGFVPKGSSWSEFISAARRWSSQAVVGQAMLILEDADSLAAPGLLFGPDGESLIEGLQLLSERSFGRFIRVVLSGSVSLARSCVENAARCGDTTGRIILRRYTEKDVEHWLEALGLTASQQVQRQLFMTSGGDPRVLRAFKAFLARNRVNIKDTDVNKFRESIVARGAWADVLVRAADAMDPTARAVLMVLAEFAPQYGEWVVTPGWLSDMLEMKDSFPDMLHGWSLDRWQTEVRTLCLLDELATPTREDPPDALGRIRKDDFWLTWLMSYSHVGVQKS